MSDWLASASISLLKREPASLVAATGLFFHALEARAEQRSIESLLGSYRGGIWGQESTIGIGYPVLRSTNMRGARVDVSDPAWCDISPLHADANALETGDILVTKPSGSSDLVGKAAVFIQPEGDDTQYLFSNFTLRLRPNQSVIVPEYLAWFLRSPQSLAWRFSTQQTTVGLRNLQTREFLGQSVPVPSKDIQTRIVEYLNALERNDHSAVELELPTYLDEQRRLVTRIEALAAKIEEARGLRRLAVEEAGLLLASASNSLFKLQPGWIKARVGEFCEHPQYGYTASATFESIGPKFLRITDIQNGRVNWDEAPYCDCPKPEQYLLQPNDLVFARTGATTGKSFLIRECPEAVFASYLIRLRVIKMVDVEYLYHYFQSPDYWSQITDEKTGTGQPNVNGQKLANIRVPTPPLEEQRRIVAYLDGLQARVDALKQLQAQTQVELDALLPSVLDRAFRGEL